MKKVLFVLTSHNALGSTGKPTGYYLSEVSHPYYVLTEKGYTIDFVSPEGGEPPVDGFNLEDPINKKFVEDKKIASKIKNTLKPDQVNTEEYICIYFAGGHGTMWDLPKNQALAELTSQIYDKGGVVGAVCHGPVGLVNVKLSTGEYLVQGKEVSCFTNDEEKAVELDHIVPFLLETKLIDRGAKHTKASNFEKHVVVSERLVSGQNPASAQGVGEEMAKLLQKG